MNGTLKAFADYIGVHKSSVTRAVQAGRLVKEPDGTLDFEKSLAAWHHTAAGNTGVSARHAAQRGAAIPEAKPTPKNATAGQDSSHAAIDAGVSIGNEGDGRLKAKTLNLHYENSQIKLEMALRRGLRFERAAAKREAFGLGALVRAGIERVIDQTAPRLAAAGNELERRRILEKEIKRLRWIIKRELPRSLRRMKEQGAGKVGAAVAKPGAAA
jgi:hypothetical protein